MSGKCLLDVCCSFKVWTRTQSHSPYWLNQKRGRIGQSSYIRETKAIWLPRSLGCGNDSRALTTEEQALFLSGHWFSWVAYLLMIGSFVRYAVGGGCRNVWCFTIMLILLSNIRMTFPLDLSTWSPVVIKGFQIASTSSWYSHNVAKRRSLVISWDHIGVPRVKNYARVRKPCKNHHFIHSHCWRRGSCSAAADVVCLRLSL